MKSFVHWFPMVLVAALAGCSLMPERVEPGTPRSEIVSRLGQPTSVHALPGGTRLQYSRQPAGQQVYNLDLDAQGRLVRSEQVLDAGWLQRNVLPDRWTREDALRELGRPALVERVWSFQGEVWTYRYLEANTNRQAHLHIDPSGVLRRLIFTDEQPVDRDGEHM